MDKIFFENIRCFASRQEARLAPLTVLVGENSSGKSTFLALVRLAWDVAMLQPLDFNEEPFLLALSIRLQMCLAREKKKSSCSVLMWCSCRART